MARSRLLKMGRICSAIPAQIDKPTPPAPADAAHATSQCASCGVWGLGCRD